MKLKNKKYFTNNDFLLTVSCPTKLYYKNNPNIYSKESGMKTFFDRIFQGNFQVLEFAKNIYKDGIQIQESNEEENIKETKNLLKKNNILILYDSNFEYKSLATKIPILIKEYERIELIFVTYNALDPYSFEDEILDVKNGDTDETKLTHLWNNVLQEMAFSFFIMKKNYPKLSLKITLMGLNPNNRTSVDNMNQLIYLVKDQQYYHLHKTENIDERFTNIFAKYDVTKVIQNIFFKTVQDEKNFEKLVIDYSKKYLKNVKINYLVGEQCKSCYYRKKEEGKKSGFNECWSHYLEIPEDNLESFFVFDLYKHKKANFSPKKNKDIFKQISIRDLYNKINKSEKETLQQEISTAGRQILQLGKHFSDDNSEYLKRDLLANEISEWQYPYHFIHLKGCLSAFPFAKKHKPFQMAVYQYSHHIMFKNGEIKHIGESFISNRGEFPSFNLIRNLKNELERDQGTVLTYSDNENNLFKMIKEDLKESEEEDKEFLIRWLDSMIVNPFVEQSSRIIQIHNRHVIHLNKMLKKYYFIPVKDQKFSLKNIFTSLISKSKYLQEKYSNPIYGKDGVILSTNFNLTPIVFFDEQNNVKNPYEMLPSAFNYSYEDLNSIFLDYSNNKVSGFLYSLLQFAELDIVEREEIKETLLKYAEFDTLIMVMIFQHLKKSITQSEKDLEKDASSS